MDRLVDVQYLLVFVLDRLVDVQCLLVFVLDRLVDVQCLLVFVLDKLEYYVSKTIYNIIIKQMHKPIYMRHTNTNMYTYIGRCLT